MASIEWRNNNTSCRIVVSCGYLPNGKKDRRSKTITFPDDMKQKQREKEAAKQAVLFEQQVENGTYLDGEKITFGEFCEKWLADYAEKQLAPGTLNPYRTRLRKRIIPSLGHIKLAKLQPHHLMEFYNNLAKGGIRLDAYYLPKPALIEVIKDTPLLTKAREIGIDDKTYSKARKGERISEESAEKICKYFNVSMADSFQEDFKSNTLSDKSIKHHHDLISSVLSTAVEWNVIVNNPAERVKAPKASKSKVLYYDDEQVLNMLILLSDEPLKYKAIIYLTIDTGLRISEVAGLEISHINLNANSITIDKQRQYVSGSGTLVKETKTESGNRRVSISDNVVSVLKAYQHEQRINRLKHGSAWVESPYFFTHEDGQPMFPYRPYQWFVKFLERNGMPHITFHGLRHTNASIMISEGVDIVTLSSRLGHADKNVTLNTYSHIITAKEKLAANKMDSFYARLDDGNMKPTESVI
jgi:integrase